MKKRIPLIIIGFISLIVLGYAALMISSMFYDKSNPRNRPNSYLVEVEVEVKKPVQYVYRFVKYQKPELYKDLHGMHDQFKILNADGLVKGAEIECSEGDDEDLIYHRYRVTEDIENKLIQYESKPSIIYDQETKKKIGKCNVYVYYDFIKLDPDRTMLKQTVVIDMLNPLYKLIGDIIGKISGSRDIWDKQFQEELDSLKTYIEK